MIDKTKIAVFALRIALSAAAVYWGQPLISGNTQAINLIVTVFSILAGFLVGIITLLGDPAMLPGKTWRGAFLAKGLLARRILRKKFLFLAYLLTLALIMVSFLVQKSQPALNVWIERSYVFLGTFAFLASLQLPWTLSRIQIDRMEAEVSKRRQKVGLDGGRAEEPRSSLTAP